MSGNRNSALWNLKNLARPAIKCSPSHIEIANYEINVLIDNRLTSAPGELLYSKYASFVYALALIMESPLEAQLQVDAKKKTKRRGRRLTGVSRQRRIANTRERNRVQILNETIDQLRELIPLFPGEKRPSKTETIRLAALYIEHMTEILESTPASTQVAMTSKEVISRNDLPANSASLLDLDSILNHEKGVLVDLEIEFLSDDAWLSNSLDSDLTTEDWLHL